jgi:hypothetical protein
MGGLFNHEQTFFESLVLWAALPVVFVWTPVRLAYEYAMVGLENCFSTKENKREANPSNREHGLPNVDDKEFFEFVREHGIANESDKVEKV